MNYQKIDVWAAILDVILDFHVTNPHTDLVPRPKRLHIKPSNLSSGRRNEICVAKPTPNALTSILDAILDFGMKNPHSNLIPRPKTLPIV